MARREIMDEGLPPRIPFLPDLVLHHENGILVTGMDGEVAWLDNALNPLGPAHRPHPMRIHRGAVAGGRLVAMWLDRELLLATMAAIPVGTSEQGASRAEVRASMGSNVTHHPKGNLWSHTLDAEPMGLTVEGTTVVFELYRRGLYSITLDAEEQWRQPSPIWQYAKPRPRSEETVGLRIHRGALLITSKGGRVQRRSLETGAVQEEFLLDGIEGPIEHHFAHHEDELVCSASGLLSWLNNGRMVNQTQMSGPVQHAAWDPRLSGWRVAGWREEAVISERTIQRSSTVEIPVHVIPQGSGAVLLMNDGSWRSSALEAEHQPDEDE